LIGNAQRADSDEVARAFRDDVAQRSEMMSPGCDASLADDFLALGCNTVNWCGQEFLRRVVSAVHTVPIKVREIF
jgi:hypothetical protein